MMSPSGDGVTSATGGCTGCIGAGAGSTGTGGAISGPGKPRNGVVGAVVAAAPPPPPPPAARAPPITKGAPTKTSVGMFGITAPGVLMPAPGFITSGTTGVVVGAMFGKSKLVGGLVSSDANPVDGPVP